MCFSGQREGTGSTTIGKINKIAQIHQSMLVSQDDLPKHEPESTCSMWCIFSMISVRVIF